MGLLGEASFGYRFYVGDQEDRIGVIVEIEVGQQADCAGVCCEGETGGGESGGGEGVLGDHNAEGSRVIGESTVFN